MHFLKRVTALLLVMAAVLCVLPVPAWGEELADYYNPQDDQLTHLELLEKLCTGFPYVGYERFPEVPQYFQQDYADVPYGGWNGTVATHGCGPDKTCNLIKTPSSPDDGVFKKGSGSMRKLYPDGKRKAFNITYDDGVLQDIRFVELLNRYGVKGTFNLNSELMRTQFAWTHPNGMEVRRLSPDAALRLYDGHEIASHTLTHPYMSELPEWELMRQMGEDRRNLEAIFHREVKGFAVPFSYYSDLIARCAENCGFEYARMSEFSESYAPCTDWYYWKTGFYHIQPGLADFAAGFLNTDQELAVCQIVGHSYDLDAENLWGTMELICAAVSAREDVWMCTNLELVRYLKAMEAFDGTNHSDQTLWFEVDGEIIALAPGEILERR